MLALEFGHKWILGDRVALDTAFFVNLYDELITLEGGTSFVSMWDLLGPGRELDLMVCVMDGLPSLGVPAYEGLDAWYGLDPQRRARAGRGRNELAGRISSRARGLGPRDALDPCREGPLR